VPTYSYKCVDRGQKIVRGTREAKHAIELARLLQSEGLMALSIAEAGTVRKSWLPQRAAAGDELSRSDLILFLSNLEMLLGAGVDLNAALSALAKSTKKKELQGLVRELRESVQKGRSFSDALSKTTARIPNVVVNSIRAGESGGQLREVLHKLSEHLTRFEKFRSDLVSSLIYPAILLAMAVLAIVLLVVVVIPQFKPLFEDAGSQLPLITRLVIGASDLVLDNSALLLLSGAGLILVVRSLLRRPRIGLYVDRAKLGLPFGAGDLLKRIEAARFTRLAALLLTNGITMIATLELTREATGNLAFAKAIDDVAVKVREGSRFTAALSATGIIPGLYRDILEAGEEASQLEMVLTRVAEMAERETELALKNFMAVFVPLLTMALGGFVASIVASVMLALLGANDLVLQ
jgi:type II secretory pathway component PulF